MVATLTPAAKSLMQPVYVYVPATTASNGQLIEYRCPCGKMVGKGLLGPGSVWEGWCKRCEHPVRFVALA